MLKEGYTIEDILGPFLLAFRLLTDGSKVWMVKLSGQGGHVVLEMVDEDTAVMVFKALTNAWTSKKILDVH